MVELKKALEIVELVDKYLTLNSTVESLEKCLTFACHSRGLELKSFNQDDPGVIDCEIENVTISFNILQRDNRDYFERQDIICVDNVAGEEDSVISYVLYNISTGVLSFDY